MKKRIPEEIVNEIINRNDIVEVISEYLPLQPGGSNHRALCPFHSEKTPSFMVSREKQIFKCFGCGAAGNVAGFIMEKENLDFLEALKILADRAHMVIPEEEMSQEAREQLQEQHELMDVHREAASFYFHNLKKPKNPGAAYLAKRGWSIVTVKKFGLGYAPDQWDALVRHMTKKGYTVKQLIAAGLAIKKEKAGVYDRFRHRVMFPIFDIRGNVIAFGGRSLTPEGTPKYLNSPETPTFNKRHLLYGLNIARTHLLQKTLLLVEGYTDVISLHEQGFKHSAATLGTSLTPDHARLVEKMAEKVILCFDGDEAGIRAAQRSIQIFRQTQLDVRILSLPKETDPDQYIHEQGAEAFQKLIEKAPHAVDYQVSMIRRKHSLATVEGKLHFARETADILKQLKSMVEREAYAGKIAEEIGVSKASFMQEIQQTNRQKVKKAASYPSPDRRQEGVSAIEAMTPLESDPLMNIERQFLKWMLVHGDQVHKLQGKINEDDFHDPAHKIIFSIIYDQPKEIEENEKKIDLFAGFEKELANIIKIEDHDQSSDQMVHGFTGFVSRYRLQQQLKHLQQQLLLSEESEDMNPKDKEDEMLKMGMEIRRINIALQQLSLQKGGKTNG